VIEEVDRGPAGLVFAARVRSRAARCRCGALSRRVHGRYVRSLRDAALGGVSVTIVLEVRRFRCANGGCPVVTFAEQVDGLTRPHGRFTSLLRRWLTRIGLALAGRSGARLAADLGLPVSRHTLLRLVRAVSDPQVPAVALLGVDDFAFRRGRCYGMLLVNLDTRRPVEMFDGRDGATLADWLRAHAQVTTICRDRAGGYADGARQGAPQAIQVADRFHLWRNLGEAVEKTVNTRRAQLSELRPQPADQAADPVTAAPPPVVQPLPEKRIVARLRQQHAAATALFAQGMSKAAIGRKLGLHPATVRKLVTARSIEDLIAKTEQRAHLVDGYVEYLHRRT
jgi:transposase